MLSSAKAATPEDIHCLALNDYFEARSEHILGRVGVAFVVLNRTKDKRWPSNICAVVKQTSANGRRCQFSWYCDVLSNVPADPVAWHNSVKLATALLDPEAKFIDPTGGSLWYHSIYIKPKWTYGLWYKRILGEHMFYNKEITK